RPTAENARRAHDDASILCRASRPSMRCRSRQRAAGVRVASSARAGIGVALGRHSNSRGGAPTIESSRTQTPSILRRKSLKATRVVCWTLALTAFACLLASTPAQAQLQSGNLYGKTLDQQGNPLPGVTVTLETGAAPQVQVTGSQGEFRFL